MKTHMNNTMAQQLKNDILSHTAFSKHQYALHSGSVKPIVVTKRKQQVKISRNNKVQINTNPNQHVNHLFNSLHNPKKSNVKSTIDNKVPQTYKFKDSVLKNKIKKNKFENYQLDEHQRELKALQNRIQNCKSIQQRKKDNYDPIVNPVYFVKDASRVDDVTIEPYSKKILSKNRPKSAVMVGSRSMNTYTLNSQSITKVTTQSKLICNYCSSVPDYSNNKSSHNNRPSTATNQKQNKPKPADDLPEPSFKGILNHLLQNKIYKDSDLKVLYVRLCYVYGQDNIDEVWESVMDHLES